MPDRVRRFRAPGRVSLIGGQVDYHEGWVVSMAINRDVTVSVRARADERVVAR
ncbi:MAG TPA: galactokinase family protein [Acidimicrobiia bacterium]|nr:galactokinase family protein [Acidimicrobiia bacterium]